MKIKSLKVAAGSMLALGLASTATTGLANAASSEEARYTHPACEGQNVMCGVIVMGDAGSFTLDWVSVESRGSQPETVHPACGDGGKKLTRDVPAGNYDTFIMPASCAYKLKIKILGGSGKDQNLYLTPGCRIVAKVSGTVGSHKWKSNEVTALNDQVPTNADGKPIDGNGYKCGKQSGAGF